MCRRSIFGVALAGALSILAANAMAGEITLYQGPGFQGRSIVTAGAISNLQRTDFDGVASSVVVRDGRWEACTRPDFTGVCAELVPGQYANLDTRLNGRVMSARQIADRRDVTRIVVAPDAPVVTSAERAVVVTEPVAEGPHVILYQHTGNGIRAVELRANVDDLGSRNFASTADAALVAGGTWRLCDAAGGRGRCAEYSPGQYVNLGALDRRVVSAYLVAPVTMTTTVPVAVVPPGRAVLYQNPNFSGTFAVVERGNAPDLDWARFTNPAASVRIESGTWLLCSELGYQGDCRVLGPGNYASLPGMTGVWSARQVWQPQYGSLDVRRVR
jgi:hypothetical protein